MTLLAEGTRASDRVYLTLREQILSGDLRAGVVLAEVEQASRLGVSRTPLREAIGRLLADGLVAQQSPRVTVVTGIDTADIRDLFELRRALETSAARLAAERGDAVLFAALAEDFAKAGRDVASDVDGCYALIARFDQAVDDAVGNGYLTSALRNVRTHLVRVRRMARDKPARLAEAMAEHRLIASALAVGDGDLAAHATHVHLHNALESILDSLPESASAASGRQRSLTKEQGAA